MTYDEPHHNLTDVEATERIRKEADRLLVRWLFGPPGRHIRDYAVTLSITGAETAPPATITTKIEEAEHGETRLVPAA